MIFSGNRRNYLSIWFNILKQGYTNFLDNDSEIFITSHGREFMVKE